MEIAIGLVLVQTGDGVAYRECGSNRAFRIVLVCDGCAEHGDDGVTDELLHGPAEALELVAGALVVDTQ